MPRVLHVLLDLTLLPAGGWIAEVGVQQVVAGHGRETCVDLARLANANPVDSGAHVIVDAAPRYATENPERLAMGVEQHLVRLQEIGADNERAAITKLGMRGLQL